MASLAHPDSMKPPLPGPTRTAPPRGLDGYPLGRPRYRAYLLYASTSLFFLLVGFLVLEAAWALGSGPEAWAAHQTRLGHPLYLLFHAFVLAMTLWFGARTFFKLFAKTQPPRIGPLPRPPLEVFPPLLAALWIGVTALLLVVLWGVFP